MAPGRGGRVQPGSDEWRAERVGATVFEVGRDLRYW